MIWETKNTPKTKRTRSGCFVMIMAVGRDYLSKEGGFSFKERMKHTTEKRDKCCCCWTLRLLRLIGEVRCELQDENSRSDFCGC